jgi:alpha-1,2-mannosyltransferase
VSEDLTTQPPHRRREWIAAGVVFALAFAVYALTIADDHVQLNLDAWSANYASWRIATTGKPWIEGLHIPSLDTNPIRDVWVIHAANGHTVIGRAPAVIAVGLPAYWITQPSTMTTVPGGITAALLVTAALVLFWVTLKNLVSPTRAMVAVLALGFATPVWSIAADGIWPHTVTILGIAGMAWAASTRRWWAVGVFGGVALWARLHAIVIVGGLGLYLGWRRRSPGLVVRVAVPALAFLAASCVWIHWMYGTWNPTGAYHSSTLESHAAESWTSVSNQLGLWISPDRGIFVWTPAVLLLLPALVRGWHELPDWSRGLLLSGLAYTVVQAALNPFTGGDLFYGYRYGLEMVACATPALALTSHRMGALARFLIGPVLAVQTFAISVGAVSNNYFLPQAEIWHRNAFLSAMGGIGVGGWVMTATAAVIGAVASLKLLPSTAETTATSPPVPVPTEV